MKRLVSVFMAVMLLVIPVTQVVAEESAVTLEEKAQAMASQIVEYYGVSGMQYAIMDNGSIALSDSAGVYDKATNEPITKDTMFGIGSVSKMYVSAATMMLADANKVDIDKPLTMYIKDFTMADERYKEITPRMLMNHTSGLYGTHYGNSMLFDDNDTENHDELLGRLQLENLKSDPGEYAVYCNDGFQLLELMIERVTGISYSEFLDTYVNTPLQLSSTKTPLDVFDRDKLAKTYFPTMDYALPVENANVLGAGGIYSTAEELTRFAEVLIGNRPDILTEQSAQLMQNPEYKNGIWVSDVSNTINYGLGWDATSLAPFSEYGITALSKGGDTVFYHAALTTIPEYNISIAVLSSGGRSIFNSIFATNVLLEYLAHKGFIKDIVPEKTFEPAVKVAMPSELLAYSGLYGSMNTTFNIEIHDGTLDLPDLMGIIAPQQYVYTGDGRFTSEDGSLVVSFEEQSNGETYVQLNSTLTFPGVGQVVMVTYEFQKLATNPLDAETKKVWDNRNGKNYYAVNEKINSLSYLVSSLLTKSIFVDTEHGYVNGTKIVDENQSVNVAEIPVMTGRDAFDFNFYKEGLTEYLSIEGFSYMSEDAVKPIYGGKSSICTIQAKGHAVWFKIDEQSANKTMKVNMPEGGGFVVYDLTGMAVHSTAAGGADSVLLPEGGMIVFGGPVGGVFTISLD